MKKALLITRPNYDIPTRYFYYWSKAVIDKAKKGGIEVVDLRVEKASRKNFRKEIKNNPLFVFMNGHVNKGATFCFDRGILMERGEEELLKSKIVCNFLSGSMEKNGFDSKKSSATALIGYDKDFIFFCRPKPKTSPLLDESAHPFLDPLTALSIAILSGESPAQSVKKAKKIFRNNFKKSLKEKSYLAPFLLWDMNHLKLIKKERL